jgi:hypothetical protein
MRRHRPANRMLRIGFNHCQAFNTEHTEKCTEKARSSSRRQTVPTSPCCRGHVPVGAATSCDPLLRAFSVSFSVVLRVEFLPWQTRSSGGFDPEVTWDARFQMHDSCKASPEGDGGVGFTPAPSFTRCLRCRAGHDGWGEEILLFRSRYVGAFAFAPHDPGQPTLVNPSWPAPSRGAVQTINCFNRRRAHAPAR